MSRPSYKKSNYLKFLLEEKKITFNNAFFQYQKLLVKKKLTIKTKSEFASNINYILPLNKKYCPGCDNILNSDKFYDGERSKGKSGVCKECHKKQGRKRYNTEDGYKRHWAKGTIRNHKKRNHKILFTVEELFQYIKNKKECELCNCLLEWGKGKISPNSPTLDRKDNEKIITLENILITCHGCNAGKDNGTLEEYVKRCERVIKNKNNIKELNR